MKKILVTGRFNVLHPGHIRLLRFAKECGGILIVGVESDLLSGKEAHVPEDLRLEGILSNSWVDEAYIIRNSVQMFIEEIKPNILVKGKEHENGFNPEIAVLKKFGGKLLFSSGETFFSSIDLLNKEEKSERRSITRLPNDFLNRHSFDKKRIKTIINGFNELRVCVIGDLIVDEYINCQPLGMSQEDPTIVVAPVETKTFLGGAGIVAAHAAGLGANVSFYSVVGDDAGFDLAKSELTRYGIDANIWKDRTRPTTRKQRYRAQGKTLLRVNHFRQHWIEDQLISEIISEMKSRLDHCDVLIFSDFNYGCVPQVLVDQITEYAQKRGVLMVADSQASSQMSDISRFKFMSLITPTEREARLAVRNDEVGIPYIIELLRQQGKSNNIIVTLGGDGVLISGLHNGQYTTDQIPAFNTSPLDAAGAGDSLLAASSMCLALGINIWQSAFIGSLAAACQVGRLGNVPLRAGELISELDNFA